MFAEAMNLPQGGGHEAPQAPRDANAQRASGGYPRRPALRLATARARTEFAGATTRLRPAPAGAAPAQQPQSDTLRSIRERLQQR